jgi:putative FmdB family regulatory protein
MPIYEYEPADHECLICEGRIEVLQRVNDPKFRFCPFCGLKVKRVVSRAMGKVSKSVTPEKAAKKGFTTFRRAGKGVWEKIATAENLPPEPEEGDQE